MVEENPASRSNYFALSKKVAIYKKTFIKVGVYINIPLLELLIVHSLLEFKQSTLKQHFDNPYKPHKISKFNKLRVSYFSSKAIVTAKILLYDYLNG